ncbi:MAG: VOC family protein [Planctomycetes bacterium]|nr:VOC family protein [Planctomycetota bacterium]
MTRPDLGLTHVALTARDVDASAAFYGRYAAMKVVHARGEAPGRRVVWLSDATRPFVIVLIESHDVTARLDGIAHLGVGCASREEVDRLAEQARAEGRLRLGPLDEGPPVGYYALIADPDGHNLEVSFGQEVGLTVENA